VSINTKVRTTPESVVGDAEVNHIGPAAFATNSQEHCHGSGNEVPHERGRREKTQAGIPRETIAVERIWNKRPDGFAIRMPTTEKAGEFVILEFKRISCVTDQYATRAKNVAVAQYASLKSALERTLNPQGWTVNQRSFIAGARSLNEKDLHDNLAYFKVPQASIKSIRSKLALKYLTYVQIS
jgi:hypothetical protein